MYFYMYPHVCSPVLHVHVYITRAHYKNATFLLYWLYWDGIATEEEIALSTVEVTCGEQALPSNSTVHIYSQNTLILSTQELHAQMHKAMSQTIVARVTL